jgi:uncharacterized membrane protein (DUF2068 family)
MSDPGRTRALNTHHPVATRRTLRAIAVFEGIKGIAALAAIVGVLDLMHHDVRHLAIELIGRFHLNPVAHYPSILLHYADILPHANLRSLVLLASVYISARLLECIGLWNGRAWAEWLGALSGGLYVPFEFAHLMHRPSVITGVVLVVNVFLVGFLAFQLWQRRHRAGSQVGR